MASVPVDESVGEPAVPLVVADLLALGSTERRRVARKSSRIPAGATPRVTRVPVIGR
jgi:hypothetical protein